MADKAAYGATLPLARASAKDHYPHSGPLISRRVVGIPVAYARSRASRFRTVVECHRPPRAVRMPRALSALAIASKLVAPAALMLSITGSAFAAN